MESFFEMAEIDEDDITILRKGIENHFDNNYIIASHLIVLRIESVLRNTIRFAGISDIVHEVDKTGVRMRRKILSLLREDKVNHLLGEKLNRMPKYFLVDYTGRNYRNRLCHGLSRIDELNPLNSSTLIWLLIAISYKRMQILSSV